MSKHELISPHTVPSELGAPTSELTVDIQVSTAKQYPRSVPAAIDEARTLALVDEDTAADCFYRIPRAGKTIEGPSVRLAEIVAYSWGNLRVDTRVISVDDHWVTAQATGIDLQRNNAVRMTARRKITDKNGKRFSTDMIAVTANAACAVAFREAVFHLVPRCYVNSIMEECKSLALGKTKSVSVRRTNALKFFQTAGATIEQVLAYLGRDSVSDLTDDDLLELRGVATAIKDGDTTLEEALRIQPPMDQAAPESKIAAAVAAAGAPDAESTPEQVPPPKSLDDYLDVELPPWVPPFRSAIKRARTVNGVAKVLDEHRDELQSLHDAHPDVRHALIAEAEARLESVNKIEEEEV